MNRRILPIRGAMAESQAFTIAEAADWFVMESAIPMPKVNLAAALVCLRPLAPAAHSPAWTR